MTLLHLPLDKHREKSAVPYFAEFVGQKSGEDAIFYLAKDVILFPPFCLTSRALYRNFTTKNCAEEESINCTTVPNEVQ
jgi:hypothetical protein